MIDAPLLTLNEGKAKAFDQAAHAARAASRPANGPRQWTVLMADMDAIVRDAIHSAHGLRELWEHAWGHVELSSDADLQTIGDRLRRLLADWHGLLTGFRQDVAGCQAEGYPAASAADLGPALEEIARLQQALEQNWPWPDRPGPAIDPAMIERGRQEIARGEGQDLEELIREVQGRP
jgi:hypothetical protein